ncbi:glycosyl transferase family 1 [Caballeronia sp. J97]|uniref:glycosyl transferase family 1 n=1 Tax=Caballeronia sp. J97 TaxID=2805429 RepID=UPI002AB11E6E|nr:glycosyl transferase family 1 [Caballeronia sp. J97]
MSGPVAAALPVPARPEDFVGRASATLATWLSDARLELTDSRMQQLLALRPLIWRIFAATPSGNVDYATSKFLPSASEFESPALPHADAAKRLCLLFNPESRLALDIRTLWKLDLHAAANLCIGIAGELFPGSASAHARRAEWLEWLSVHIEEIGDLSRVEVSGLWALYMHCTYAGTARRHAVKRGINALVRAKLDQFGFTDLVPDAGKRHAQGERPRMLVVAESFIAGHSIVRTHSRTLSAARKHFELVALCPPDSIDDEGRSLFDRTYDLPSIGDIPGCVRYISDFAAQERPDVLYMPSVGMSALTLFLSNLRVAPLQIAGLGHPATTHAERIDYVSVEEDFVGDPSCFSEKLLCLPKDGQPYQPSARLSAITPRIPSARPCTHVAIAASMMKLNPGFLEACSTIAERLGGAVHLHFLTSGSSILTLMHLSRILDQTLRAGTYTVHGFEPYPEYMNSLNGMDMFLSPFPFGNTNGIVDAFTVGLPGVCKTGAEVFERIDGALFARAWLPGWLVADTVEEYVEAAVRLAKNRNERESLRSSMLERNIVQRLFGGRPEVFGEMVLELVNERHSGSPPRTCGG